MIEDFDRAFKIVAELRSIPQDDDTKDDHEHRLWWETRCGDITWPLCLFVFDTAVVHGTAAAGRLLYEAADLTPNRKDRCATYLALRTERFPAPPLPLFKLALAADVS